MIGLSAKTQVLAGEYFDRVVKRERTLSVYKVIDFDYCNTGEYREYYVHKKNYESGEVGKMFLPIFLSSCLLFRFFQPCGLQCPRPRTEKTLDPIDIIG